jgi:hypothetical protein
MQEQRRKKAIGIRREKVKFASFLIKGKVAKGLI